MIYVNEVYLSVGKIYVNGIINQSQIEKESKIININLDAIKPHYNERKWTIQGSDDEGISRTFSFKKCNKLYIVPSIEIKRGILGIDSFTLRLVLQMDAIERYLSYEIEYKILKIYFTNEYNKELLTSEKIYHLAWVLTNENVLSMVNEISENYSIEAIKN